MASIGGVDILTGIAKYCSLLIGSQHFPQRVAQFKSTLPVGGSGTGFHWGNRILTGIAKYCSLLILTNFNS